MMSLPAVRPASKSSKRTLVNQKSYTEPESIPMLRIRTEDHSSSSNSSKFPSMDSGTSNRYRSGDSEAPSPTGSARAPKDRYKTTASDRDADLEVVEILSCRDSALWRSEDDVSDATCKTTSGDSPKGVRHRREVGELLRQKDKRRATVTKKGSPFSVVVDVAGVTKSAHDPSQGSF